MKTRAIARRALLAAVLLSPAVASAVSGSYKVLANNVTFSVLDYAIAEVNIHNTKNSMDTLVRVGNFTGRYDEATVIFAPGTQALPSLGAQIGFLGPSNEALPVRHVGVAAEYPSKGVKVLILRENTKPTPHNTAYIKVGQRVLLNK